LPKCSDAVRQRKQNGNEGAVNSVFDVFFPACWQYNVL
jgi:hypothetical protein